MSTTRTVTLALTGASGMPYGLRLLECLLESGASVGLVYSPAAQIVAKQECGLAIPTQPREAERWFAKRYGARAGQLAVWGRDDWMAPVASGSAPADAMAVCPCTMGTLGAIANGLADNLIERAADVALKEGKRLLVVPRETPLSIVHLENLLRLARLGAIVLPAMPGFYHAPKTKEDLVNHVVGKILDRLGVENSVGARWQGLPRPDEDEGIEPRAGGRGAP